LLSDKRLSQDDWVVARLRTFAKSKLSRRPYNPAVSVSLKPDVVARSNFIANNALSLDTDSLNYFTAKLSYATCPPTSGFRLTLTAGLYGLLDNLLFANVRNLATTQSSWLSLLSLNKASPIHYTLTKKSRFRINAKVFKNYFSARGAVGWVPTKLPNNFRSLFHSRKKTFCL
jgi:hypothetical protein